MKSAYVLSLACCLVVKGLAIAPPPLQYQDSYGQYSFGYSSPTSARSEVRTLDGVTRGSYSYIDDAGFIQTAHYIADSLGYRIIAPDTPQASVYMPPLTELRLVQLHTQNIDQMANQGKSDVTMVKKEEQEADLQFRNSLQTYLDRSHPEKSLSGNEQKADSPPRNRQSSVSQSEALKLLKEPQELLSKQKAEEENKDKYKNARLTYSNDGGVVDYSDRLF